MPPSKPVKTICRDGAQATRTGCGGRSDAVAAADPASASAATAMVANARLTSEIFPEPTALEQGPAGG